MTVQFLHDLPVSKALFVHAADEAILAALISELCAECVRLGVCMTYTPDSADSPAWLEFSCLGHTERVPISEFWYCTVKESIEALPVWVESCTA